MQIMLNFLSNAVKFTNRGGNIKVMIRIVDNQTITNPMSSCNGNIYQSQEMNSELDERYINLEMSVIDSGIGISEEGLKNLFIDFNKLDENAHLNTQGTGLGLSICKKLIEQMGGSVRAESQLGLGTQFIINIKTKCKHTHVKLHQLPMKVESHLSFGKGNRPNNTYVFVQKNRSSQEFESCINTTSAQEVKKSTIKKKNGELDHECKQLEALKRALQKMIPG